MTNPVPPRFNETSIYMAGSSHFSDRHYFKTPFINYRHQSSRIKEIEVHSISGGYLDQSWIHDMKRFVRSQSSDQQILIVVMLACNAIRKDPKDIGPILRTHDHMIRAFRHRWNVRIILCGAISSPRSDPRTRISFTRLDGALQDLASESPQSIRYFPTNSLFMKDDKIDTALFADRLHLTARGARKLIAALHDFIHECLGVHYIRGTGIHHYPIRDWSFAPKVIEGQDETTNVQD